MKYYYGNSIKEALSNEPVEIKSTRALQQYCDCYSIVIAEDELENEEEEE